MKKTIIILALLLLPAVCLADFDLSKWRYYKDVRIESAGLQRFIVDDEMFAGTEKDLRDLRIMASNQKETPFKRVLGSERGKTSALSPKMINNSYLPGEHTSVILDFGINHQGVNRLKINTGAENFQRNVTVYGSEDIKIWSILKDKAYIYDYTDKRGGLKSRDTTLNFSESLFRYLKIEIADENNTPVRIVSVSGAKYTPAKIKELIQDPEYNYKTDQKTKNTEIYIDLGSSGVPTGKLNLSVKDGNFNRGATVYSSFNNIVWHKVGQGYIFRYNTPRFTGENLELNFSETNERYIKLVIKNYDDAPLNITGVKTFSIYREVIFKTETDKAYRVYYGNKDARFPRYDFEKYFQYLDMESARGASLSEQKNNKRYASTEKPIATPKSEQLPYLMPAALVLAATLLMFLVYGFLRKKV